MKFGTDQKKATPTTAAGIAVDAEASILPLLRTGQADDYILELRWSPCGRQLAALPSTGAPQILNLDGDGISLPAHTPGNGSLAWNPDGRQLATFGQDGRLRVHTLATETDAASTRELPLPRGWAERIAWSADGSRIAAAVGRGVHIITAATLELETCIENSGATVCDLVWHPERPDEFATASNGGARLWKLGQTAPIEALDDGVAALCITWSPDGRWVVTGDHTPSVHLHDRERPDPLHIQGFEKKVKCFAWQTAGAEQLPWLAVGGGSLITVWPCFGPEGPRGTSPINLTGHRREVNALDFSHHSEVLASGGADGDVLLWMPHRATVPGLVAEEPDEITAVHWAPDGRHLAYGTASGKVAIHQLPAQSKS